MDSRWTNINAIYRDLSLAQGRPPVEIENTIAYNERPPRDSFEEETEEEYLGDTVGNCDFTNGPDLQMIQQMLDMVRDVDLDTENLNKDKDEGNNVKTMSQNVPSVSDNHIVVSKPEVFSQDVKKPVVKKMRNRNAAMASLIETYGDSSNLNKPNVENKSHDILSHHTNSTNNGLTIIGKNQNELAKRNSSHLSSLNNETEIKVNDWLSLYFDDSSNDKVNAWLTDNNVTGTAATSMFRKKTNVAVESSILDKKDLAQTNTVSECSSVNAKTEMFVPSTRANEYYEKFVERSKTQTKEDIWTKAKRQMLEIEERRIKEKSNTMSSIHNIPVGGPEARGMDAVTLSQHRHELSAECVVCEVLCEPRSNKQDNDRQNMLY